MLTVVGENYRQDQTSYSPRDVAARMRVSGQRLRQLAAVYERVYGNLPRDERGRVWPEEAVERLDVAHKAVVAGRARSVEQALRAPESAAAGAKVMDGPGAYGRLDTNILSLLEELRHLRAAIEGMSHRLASLERGNHELREAVRAGRSLKASESRDST